MEKENQYASALNDLIRYFKEHASYNNLTKDDISNFKEYIKDIVELSKQPYYNQLIEEYFSKLPSKEENTSYNIFKAFEDKAARILRSQNKKNDKTYNP